MTTPTLFKEYIWLVNTINQAGNITLDDINKFTELLENDTMIDEINRGQINTRGDKSSFNISFSYATPKKEDPKAKKGKKKGKENND